jgi:transcriptional antiterminator RfaH
MLRWYAVHTKPLREIDAQLNLEHQGYEVYFPRTVHPVRRRQRAYQQVGPLFPRYLFVRVDEGNQSLRPVHSTPGVTSVVRFGSRYTIVPDRLIGELRAREVPETGLHRLSDKRRLAPGSRVTMVEGPFAGLEGVFAREVGDERVVVLLELLGHDVTVRVPSDLIMPAIAL